MSTVDTKELFEVVNGGVNSALRARYGGLPSHEVGAAIAVALLQLSLRYFAETKAPKGVVLDFVQSLLGSDAEGYGSKEKPKLTETRDGIIHLPTKVGRVL